MKTHRGFTGSRTKGTHTAVSVQRKSMTQTAAQCDDLRSLSEAYARLQPDTVDLQPEPEEADAKRDLRYGEILMSDFPKLLALLLNCSRCEEQEEDCFVDIGSGTGKLVLYAAMSGLLSYGIELVQRRHNVGKEVLQALSHDRRFGRASLRCADALSPSEAHIILGGSLFFCNNAVWSEQLTAEIVRGLAPDHAPRLAALITLKEVPVDALEAAGLVLARASCVSVTWDPLGWPLFLYRPLAAEPDPQEQQEQQEQQQRAWPVIDEAFVIGLESRDGIAMYG